MTRPLLPDAKQIGAAVRFLRRARGLSQGELGGRLDPPLSHVAVGFAEQGKRRFDTAFLNQLAAVLDVDAAWFLAPAPRCPLCGGQLPALQEVPC